MRLNKFLSSCGIASRRKCDELIKNGKIIVYGKVVSELGSVINEIKDKS
jgi:23S rRNA pseudouridine2605 synthase